MEGYCIWFTEGAMNKLLNTGFQCEEIRKSLAGEVSFSVIGAVVDISWNITKSPQVSFSDIDRNLECVDEHGQTLAIEEGMFVISTEVTLWVKEGGVSNVPMLFVANPAINTDQSVAFKMVGIQMSESYGKLDRAILRAVCSALLTGINKALGFIGEKTPRVISLDFLTDFGIPSMPDRGIMRKSGQIGVWGSDGYKNLDTIIPDNMDVGIVITNGLYVRVVSKQFSSVVSGWNTDVHYSKDVGLCTVYSSAYITIERLWCDGAVGNGLSIRLTPIVDLSITAKLLPDLAFGIEFTPRDIRAMAGTTIERENIHVQIESLDRFELSLNCKDGNGLSVIVEEIIKLFAPLVTDNVEQAIRKNCKFSFSTKIPEATIPTGIASLHAKLTDYQSVPTGYLQVLYAKLGVGLET